MTRSLHHAAVLCASFLVSTSLSAVPAVAADPQGDNAVARAALADLQATIKVITDVEDGYSTDPATYRNAAQRAVNVLVGSRDGMYRPAAGTPEDTNGAIGRIDALLDRNATPRWVDALRGSEVNARAAVGRLQGARQAHELTDFQIAVSQALTSLQVAVGRANDASVFGGIQGALSTTDLGVPQGAATVDACHPSGAGWGIHDGYLAFVSVSPGAPAPALTEALGVVSVSTQDGMVLLRTAAWPAVSQACGDGSSTAAPASKPSPDQHAAAKAPDAASQPVTAPPGSDSKATSVASGSPGDDQSQPAPATNAASQTTASPPQAQPALYTTAQAQAGEKIYATNCVSCHGTNLHGVAAPAVAGTEFLKAAQDNDWTLSQIRYIVTALMPFNAAGSLSPEQYAEVMAFLLASNCFPAGQTPFPSDDKPDFAKVQFAPPSAPAPGQNSLGVCPVR